MKTQTKTRILAECALMLALASVLSKLEIPLWLQGGSITACSMLPLLLVSYRWGARWGLLTAFCHGLIQMALGFQNVLYCKTLLTQTACILLDYLLAFSLIGLASAVCGRNGSPAGVAVGSGVVIFGRFLCSFASGILLWGEYAPESQPVWLYSLTYNGGYMLPELVITVAAAVLLARCTSLVRSQQQ